MGWRKEKRTYLAQFLGLALLLAFLFELIILQQNCKYVSDSIPQPSIKHAQG